MKTGASKAKSVKKKFNKSSIKRNKRGQQRQNDELARKATAEHLRRCWY